MIPRGIRSCQTAAVRNVGEMTRQHRGNRGTNTWSLPCQIALYSTMDITPANPNIPRPRSRSRTRNSTANSRSTSSNRRPSLGRRSLSSSSLTKLQVSNKLQVATSEGENTVPSVNATLDNSLPIDFFKQDIWVLIKTLKISKWHKKPLKPQKIHVNRISGALTNSIYKIEYKDDKIKIPSLLLRVYGKNVDDIIDRDLELQVLVKLSMKHIGPKLLGIFSNGRFEQFLEGFVTLQKEQIKDQVLSQMIGRRMKDLHYKIELERRDYLGNTPMCWKLIDKWLNIYETNLRDNFKQNGVADEDIFFMPYEKFKQKIETYRDWLFSKYDHEGFASNFRFCHNDTQYGNLLLHESFDHEDVLMTDEDNIVANTSNKKDNCLAVIDFEYGGANFPAFDLVNHMSEWMANYHDPERLYFLYEKWFPSKLEQVNLLKAYVEYDFQYPSSNLKVKNLPELNRTNATELVEFEIKKIYNECVFWRASVQLYWCAWGLIQRGPFVTKDIVDDLGSTSEERGVDGTYKITTGLNGVSLNESAIEDEITSSDDLFDYLKYSQQKAALAVGDFVQLGLVDQSEVKGELKYLNCELYDL